MVSTTASKKAKGRKFQQTIRDKLLNAFRQLDEGDIRSCSMGANGEDIQLSPLAKKTIGISAECKHRKSFSIYTVYDQAVTNCIGAEPVAFIKADYKKPLAVVDADYFIKLLKGKSK